MGVSSLLSTSDDVGGDGEPMEMKFLGPMVEPVKSLVEEL